MKKILFVLFFSIVGTFVQSQTVEQRIMDYTQQNSIDTFLVYLYEDFEGPKVDSCQNPGMHYLIWEKHGEFYLKKFACYENFKSQSINHKNPLTYYLKNAKQINREEIKSPFYAETYKTSYDVTMTKSQTVTSHGFARHIFLFPPRMNPLRKSAGVFDLNFKKFDDGNKNTNYKSNKKTQLKALIDFMKKFINQLNKKGKFEKE